MQKDLYIKEKSQNIVVKNDDLIFDGKNIVIPSYYASIISEYLDNVDFAVLHILQQGTILVSKYHKLLSNLSIQFIFTNSSVFILSTIVLLCSNQQ